MGKRSTIQKNSLSEQAYQTLKERILSGETPPGTRLIIEDLAVDLGISRTPVRDGLSKLISSGLVSCSGYIVATYTSKDVKELFAIRKALEVLAIRETTKNIATDKLDRFRSQCNKTKKHIKQSEVVDSILVQLNTNFHNLIIENFMNDRLQKILHEIHEKIWLIINGDF